MSWLSALSATASPRRRASRRVSALSISPKGKRRRGELLGRGRVEEVALVALRVGGAVEGAAAVRLRPARHVVAGGQHVGPELAGGVEEVAELDGAVALDAGHRSLARQVALGEAVDHRLPETGLVIEDVVRDAERVGHPARVVNVLAGAAGSLAMGRGAVVVELERDAHDLVALLREKGRHHGGVDAARHRDHHARAGRRLRQIEGIEHGCRAFEARASSRRGGLGSIVILRRLRQGGLRLGEDKARRPA